MGILCPTGNMQGICNMGSLECTNYHVTSLVWAVGVLLFMWGIYCFLLQPRIKKPKDVFRLRNPFYISMGLVFIIILVVGMGLFYQKFGGVPSSCLAYSLGWSVLLAVAGTLLFWGLTIIYSPPKLKYAPWLRRKIVG